MTNFTADASLAQIMIEQPSAASVLEARGLDYCCGGMTTLKDACTTAGIDPLAVLSEINSLDDYSRNDDFSSLSPAALTDHIEATHHHYLHQEFGRLEALVKKVLGVHGAKHPELLVVQDVYMELRSDLEAHLAKEERVLFPMIRELSTATVQPDFQCGSINNPVSMMMMEHDRAGMLIRHLRTATGDFSPPADACASYIALFDGLRQLEADTHLHIHKENNLLFPAVVELEQELTAATPA